MKEYRGGTAFPFCVTDNGQPSVSSQGMSLRDYFAAKAMQGFAVSDNTNWKDGLNGMAEFAYKWADAMLAEREK